MVDIFDGWGLTKGRLEGYGHRRERLDAVYRERGIQELCGRCGRGCKVLGGEGWSSFVCYDYREKI